MASILVFELPKSLGFEDAMEKVGTVISFATFPDETAVASDYVFPTVMVSSSWGYQRVATGTRSLFFPACSRLFPAFTRKTAPELLYEARTADVLIAAAQAAGGSAAQALPYADEVGYIQSQIASSHWPAKWLLYCA